MVSIVTLISGRGSNFEAIVKTAQKEQWPVQFAGVIANHSAAKGLDFARLQGIPAFTIEHQEHATRESFDAALIQQIDELGADLVVLAGFMRILTPGFIRHFEGRLINIHPALLPKYGGKGMYGHFVHEAVIANGEKESGISIHLVDDHYDHGKLLFQAACAVTEDDDAITLAKKIHALEQQHFPLVVHEYLQKQNQR